MWGGEQIEPPGIKQHVTFMLSKCQKEKKKWEAGKISKGIMTGNCKLRQKQ